MKAAFNMNFLGIRAVLVIEILFVQGMLHLMDKRLLKK